MRRSLGNRVALITGAGSGLGRQLALRLANEGVVIAAVDLKDEPLQSLAAQLQGKGIGWAVADVTDRAGLHAAVVQLEKKLGPIYLLVANAGIGMENSALAFRACDFEAQLRVNTIGVANSVEAVLPGLLLRREGHVVAISSLASFRGLPKILGYCASKAGVNALMDGLRYELRPHGIAVTTICPGWIDTPLTAHVGIPREELIPVDVAARRIVRIIQRRQAFAAFPTGPAWVLRLLRNLPVRWSDAILGRLLRRAGRG